MRTILLILIGLSSLLSAEFSRDTTGTLRDSATELIWQGDTITAMTWQSSIEYCEALTLEGKDDWRLPNLNELNSLVDDTKVDPSINDIFADTVSNNYWSSTTHVNNSNNAWFVSFSQGIQIDQNKENYGYIRCVRGGQ